MLRVTPDGKEVWVQTSDASTNVVLDADSLATLATTPVDTSPVTVAFQPGSGRYGLVMHVQGHSVVVLDRRLFTATTYPADYGFIPDTLSEDGDPLDALVMLEDATFPGCWITARPVGVFWMEDDAGPDAKILCVPAGDPRWEQVGDMSDLPPHLVDEIEHFFEVYKVLEPEKHSNVRGWEGVEAAVEEIAACRKRYADTQH